MSKEIKVVEKQAYTGKFKVGDKVKAVSVLDYESEHCLTENINKVGIVSEISPGVKYSYTVDYGDGKTDIFNEATLELVTERESVYLAGPISTEGDVMFMSYLAEELRKLDYHVHAPHEDEAINDKTNNPESSQIFRNDGDAINTSDIVVLVESGREQVGTHLEAGKIIERIENGTTPDLELVVFTSNYRVENTQVEDGKASASVNHYALGGYKSVGTWVDGMSAGLIEYMKERKERVQVEDEAEVDVEMSHIFVGDEVLSDCHVNSRWLVTQVGYEFVDLTSLEDSGAVSKALFNEQLVRCYYKIVNDNELYDFEEGRIVGELTSEGVVDLF